MNRVQLGREIKEIRKSLGFTQATFSKKLRVSQSHMSKVENGKLEFLATTYIRFLKFKSKPQ